MKGRVLDAGIGLYCRGWVSGHKGRREASLPVCWSCRERASPAGWQPNRAARPEVYHRERAVEVGARGRGSVVAGAMENWPICRGFDWCFPSSKTGCGVKWNPRTVVAGSYSQGALGSDDRIISLACASFGIYN